jgi:MFS family permease
MTQQAGGAHDTPADGSPRQARTPRATTQRATTQRATKQRARKQQGRKQRARKRSLHGLVLAYGISQLGTSMSGLAIPWLVLVTTGSAAKTGLVGFAEMAPYVVLQAIAGPVVDRVGLRRSCITANAAAAVLVCAIPGLYALGSLSLGALIALVAVAGATRGAADAAESPLVPRSAALGQVPNERAAGLNSVAQRTGMLAGLPLAGVLIAASNAATVVLIDGVTFAVAALLVTLLTPAAVDQAQAAASAPEDRLTVRAYWSRLGEGMRFIRADRLIAGIALMVAITNLLDQSLSSVLIPVWVRERLHHPSGLGLIGGASAIGLVIGALAGTWLGHRMPRHAAFAIGFLLGGSPVFIALAVSATLPPVLVVGVLSGLAGGVLNPIVGAVAYERVPAQLQARVLGAFRSSAWIGIPFGSLLGGALTERIGLRNALLVTGAAMFVTTLAPFVFPAWRGLDRSVPAPQAVRPASP